MANVGSFREINDETWDRKEFEWTGKSFYFVTITFLFGTPLGLDAKLEQLNRELRQAGYKVKNPMILIEHGKFKGRAMIEVEKKDQYHAQIQTYEVHTDCDTIVHYGGVGTLGKGIARLKERVASRRMREPRSIFYMYQPDPNAGKTILFALT